MKRFFRFTYKSEAEIDATRQTVWKVLADSSSYPKWNPFTIRVDSEWKLGKEVFLTVRMKPNQTPTRRTEYLAKFKDPEVMAWGLDWGWWLKAMRTQRLEVINARKTKYLNEDIIYGLLSPLVHVLFGKWVQKGFNEIAVALKSYVENHVDER